MVFMFVFNENWLVVVMGFVKGKYGVVIVCNILIDEEFIIYFSMIRKEELFFDILEDDGIIYVIMI